MQNKNQLPVLIFIVILALGIIYAYFNYDPLMPAKSMIIAAATLLIALFVSNSIKIANQWERVVLLRIGKFSSLRGPGLFFIIPIVDTLPYWIDLRVITTSFKAEKTLTKDTVPVDVDAVLFWQVFDAAKTALEVEDYHNAISWAAQTALRDVIGKTMLADMLEGRERIDDELQRIISAKTQAWGIKVLAVEIRDVLIPQGLQAAMSMQAQAERERQARVILGDSERQIAEKFIDASKHYLANPTALHLRAMNMLYEGLKQNATLIIVPSTAVDSMQLGTYAGLAALQKELAQEKKSIKESEKESESGNNT